MFRRLIRIVVLLAVLVEILGCDKCPFKDLIEASEVNFTESVAIVNMICRNGCSKYVRDATEADDHGRQFLSNEDNEDFAESLKRGKGFAGGYAALRKGRCGKVFYAFVQNLNRRQNIGEIARLSPHFDSVRDLELFERIYIRSGIQCWRMNARDLDPDPLGEYFYADTATRRTKSCD